MLVERITSLCEKEGISLSELERRAGLGRGIYRWNTSAPSSDKLLKVAEYFGVSVDSILGREELPEELPLNEHEAAVLARYNSLSAENRALIDELMEKLKSQK